MIIAVLAAITIVAFVAIIGAAILANAAIHREERRNTLLRRAPGTPAELARIVLGVYIRRMEDEPSEVLAHEELPAWYERTTGQGRP
jgi:hypothetical protein